MDCDEGTLDIDTNYVTALDNAPQNDEVISLKYHRQQGKVVYQGGFHNN